MSILFYKVSDTYGCFSNFAKYSIKVDNINFNCNEQFIMYKKAILFNDLITAELILRSDSPFYIKSLGRSVRNFDHGMKMLI